LEEVCNGVVHPVTKQTINKYEHLVRDETLADIWRKAMCRELGRLTQGFDDIKCTNTIKFLTLDEIRNIPSDKKITYVRIVVDHRPHKPKEPNRMRLAVGGNLIKYPGELTICTAGLTTTKILWNSIISIDDARFMTADVKKITLALRLIGTNT